MAFKRTAILARGSAPSAAGRVALNLLVRELQSPLRVWSSIELLTPDGQAMAIDLAILGLYGLYVVDAKGFTGKITEAERDWVVTSSDGTARSFLNPLEVTQTKARLVWVEPLIVLTSPKVELAISAAARSRVVTPRELLWAAQFGDLPGVPAPPERTPVDAASAEAVARFFEQVRPRPRQGRGGLHDELQLLVRDLDLSLRERHAPQHAAASWVLSCSFVRCLEERGLLETNHLAGEGAEEAEEAFLAGDPVHTVSDYVHQMLSSIASLSAGEAVFAQWDSSISSVPLSDSEARAVLDFFRQRGPSGKRRWSFAGDPWTDFYQQVSPDHRDEYGKVATPAFIDEMLLDLTLTPALDEVGFDGTRVMDPVCGSGRLLSEAFVRLHDHIRRVSPGIDPVPGALAALDRIHGADVSPVAVLITRIRLVLTYLARTECRRFSDVPRLPCRISTADSLVVGRDGEPVDPGVDGMFHGKYTVVIGEPPFVTCKNASSRELYRRLYPRSATGQFSLAAPFVERFWDLATEGGFVGIFTSNSFARREFGKCLIEEVLIELDVTRIIDTSGVYIPGHGTPTLLLVGRNRRPATNTVRVVVGKRGEPFALIDPARGEIWSAIRAHYDEVG